MTTTTYRVCCFLRRFRAATDGPSEAVGDVFRAYAGGGGGVLGEEALRRFLREVQGLEDVAAEQEAREVMAFARKHRLLKKGGGGVDVDGFHRWLCSDDNAALDPRRGVHHDMGLPLSHYFIYTGHNSYLTGNQLSSGCSEAPIVKALRDGVRVIELDLWPNAAKDDVHVLHGKTLTSPVELTKCLDAIKEHAFVASPYPVILTLEDHLTPALQAKVAKLIKQTFGDMLFVAESEHMTEFPSPDALKRKILISTKPPKKYLLQTAKSGKDGEEAGKEISDDDKQQGMDDDDQQAEEEEEEEEAEKKGPDDGDDEYKRLIAIPLTRRTHDMDKDLAVDPVAVSRLSLGEKAYEKATVTHGADIIRFTQRNLLRVYPRSTRITSSNYNPMMGWVYGVQMVAANMQGHGRELWLTQGMFSANGGCGYVRKPDILMNNNSSSKSDDVFDPSISSRGGANILLPVKTTLKVTVYTGHGWRSDFRETHFDRCSPPDFYATVGIAGVAADARSMDEQRTGVATDAWSPAWDHEFAAFPLAAPELALLRVEVHESDNHRTDEFAGQTCLPVRELRPGLRSVRLRDLQGRPLPSVRLLMRFDFFPPASSSSS